MSIRISDPLLLLSAQTGLSATELVAGAAAGNPDLEKPQEALKTGEPIPILFARRRNSNGGVMVQPKMTEAFFSNTIVEKDISTDGGTVVAKVPFERIQLKYLLVLSEGNLPQIQIRDLFHGTCRHGTFNQVFDGRAGTWNPGNDMYDFFTFTASLNASNVYAFDISTLTTGQSVNYPDGTRYYYRSSDNTTYQLKRKEHGFPVFCGTSGSYSGLTTLSFERTFDDVDSETLRKTLNVFVREGLQVTRLVDSTSGPSDNYVDLVKYLFQANNRLADDLIDNTTLTTAAKFVDANSFLFNGEITNSQNLLDWLQDTSVNFLLRVINTNGKFGMQPRLPYNTDHTIKTTQVTPEFTFTEKHVVEGGFEIEYISLEDREPVCFVVQWRQQPEANFGLVRTVEVRYTGEAASGPFMNIDMSNYCTNEDHAVKVGTFRLAQRKFITHHLRLTVREQNYNSTLVVGDLVRVRLRRETSEGAVEHHDKLYEINRIEKTFTSTITYDLTHFPIDSQGRSIVARQVAAASGAGNTIDVGRSDFDCDENSSTDTTLIGTSSGGGGTVPSTGDTGFNIPTPSDTDSSYPDGENNPDDPLDQSLDSTDSLGAATVGDNVEIPASDLACDGRVCFYRQNKTTGERTLKQCVNKPISGPYQSFITTDDIDHFIVAIGQCPDPSDPSGFGPEINLGQTESVNPDTTQYAYVRFSGTISTSTASSGTSSSSVTTNWTAVTSSIGLRGLYGCILGPTPITGTSSDNIFAGPSDSFRQWRTAVWAVAGVAQGGSLALGGITGNACGGGGGGASVGFGASASEITTYRIVGAWEFSNDQSTIEATWNGDRDDEQVPTNTIPGA